MERLPGPIDPCFLGEHLEYLEQGSGLDFGYGGLLNTEGLKFEKPLTNFNFHDKVPFLQMLGLETPSTCPETEPNLQLLVRLEQEKKPWRRSYFAEVDSRVAALELESCITHASESHSPDKSDTKDHHYQLSTSCPEVASSACNLESNSPGSYSTRKSCPASMWAGNETEQLLKSPTIRDKKKRKRTKPCKNSEEVESQRMTHIAVERNRRKMMNDHLNALRSLMPSSFVQRGDQASIIGGAIDFVKELEQLLQSLQAQKRHRQTEEEEGYNLDSSSPFDGFFSSPQYSAFSASQIESGEHTAANRSVVANIEVTVIQAHVNLKILSPRRRGQLLKAITALEDLSLTILHLNVTSLDQSVLYSFNLKIEEECKLGSADKIATAVYQIFSYINGN